MTRKDAVARWGEQDAVVRVAKLIEQAAVIDSEDLAGLPLPGPRTVKAKRFRGCSLDWANLSAWWVEDCAFERVRFREADLTAWRDHGNQFQQCLFERTRLRDAGLGFKGSRYEDCVFAGVDFRKTAFARSEFDRCTFRHCRFNGVDFYASSFEECQFVGPVVDAWFRGGYPPEDDGRRFGIARQNRMWNVRFTDANLRWLTFSDNCDLSTCLLPEDDMVVRFANWPGVLTAAKTRAATIPSVNESEWATKCLSAYEVHASRGQWWYIINFADVAERTSHAFAQKLRALLVEAAQRVVL